MRRNGTIPYIDGPTNVWRRREDAVRRSVFIQNIGRRAKIRGMRAFAPSVAGREGCMSKDIWMMLQHRLSSDGRMM